MVLIPTLQLHFVASCFASNFFTARHQSAAHAGSSVILVHNHVLNLCPGPRRVCDIGDNHHCDGANHRFPQHSNQQLYPWLGAYAIDCLHSFRKTWEFWGTTKLTIKLKERLQILCQSAADD